LANVSPEVASARGRIAALSRSRNETDPALVEAKKALAEAKLTSDIERLVANAPALTTAQLFKLRSLLDLEGVK
jgi:hypothetical protein